jgi:DNA-binding winged helix-turn-helix (wHTH) protein/tetratricopeptide (TPR) repeat protein
VNEAVGVPTEGLLTTAGLAARSDFTLGLAIISPSTRTIAGPGGTTDVEPRVMQVLVVLADAAGQVVTRETLFQRCWGGVYVGDDSLNRAIGAVRKLGADIADGSFEIDTIPRTGYRLSGTVAAVGPTDQAAPGMGFGLTRRQWAAGALATAVFAGAAIWATVKVEADRRFDDLMERGTDAMRKGAWDARTAAILSDAIAIRPDSAKAWGLLALLKSGLAQPVRSKASAAVAQAESAARRALSLDSNEPNALLAMLELEGSTLDWATRDRRLRRIIGLDQGNIFAIAQLVLLLQAAGLNRESWNWNERALALEPLSADFLGKRALKLWIAGRLSEADKVIDQVRALYPDDSGVWWVRLLIFALTGRAPAAQAMLDADPQRLGTKEDVSLWRTAIAAFEQGSRDNKARARQAAFEAARAPGGSAGEGVMILSALGEVDAAFDVANGFLLSRGAIVRSGRPSPQVELNDAISRINTQWLFTPPCTPMRADPRFVPLCEAVGLADYWRSRGVRPDYQRTEQP